MKITAFAAPITVATLLTTLATAPTHAATETKEVAGYTVFRDTVKRTCSITATPTAVANTKQYGADMWPDAEKAILSTKLTWAQQSADAINTARLAGKKSNDGAVITPMTGLEAVSLLRAGNDIHEFLNTAQQIPGLQLLIQPLMASTPNGAEIAKKVFGVINAFVDTNALMLPGELAARFVNPAVDASTPFVKENGQDFKFDQAEGEARRYFAQQEHPSYAAVPLGGAAAVQSQALSEKFKQAWANYNRDAAQALATCAGITLKSTLTKPTAAAATPTNTASPTAANPTAANPSTANPSNTNAAFDDNLNKPGVAGFNGNAPATTAQPTPGNGLSSQIDAADKASSLVGNEHGATKVITIASIAGVVMALFMAMAALPWLKPVLPPEIAKLIP